MERAVGGQALGAPKRFLGLRQPFIDIGAERLEGEEFFGRSARNHTLDVPDRIFCFRQPGGDASRQVMEGRVGNEPFGSSERFLGLRQPFIDIGAERLEGEEFFGRSARNHTLDVPDRIFCFRQPGGDASRQVMEGRVGNEPFGSSERFLGLRQPFIDIGAERLEGEEFFGRSARNHTLDVPDRIFCFRQPGGDASRQVMEGTVGNEPFGASLCFLSVHQPLVDAGAECLERRHSFDVRLQLPYRLTRRTIIDNGDRHWMPTAVSRMLCARDGLRRPARIGLRRPGARTGSGGEVCRVG